jgi:GNAT superfamily N-acetyltransferase
LLAIATMPRADDALKIRRAVARDAPALSRLLHEVGFPSSSSEVAKRLKSLPNPVFVAVRNRKVIGLLTTNIMPVLHRPTAVGRLSALFVSKQERSRGVGRALVAAAEQYLKSVGCALVEVTSNLRLKDAHAFYEHLGYEATSVRFKRALHPKG